MGWFIMTKKFTAYIEWDPESKMYVGIVPGIHGAHTQGGTLDELRVNLKEVLELCMEEYGYEEDQSTRFIGLEQIEIAI